MRSLDALLQKVLLASVAGAFAAACGPPPPPPPPDPPRVSLTASGSKVVDAHLDVTLSVSGCEEVSGLEIWNGDHRAAEVPYAGNPTQVRLARNSFQYKKIAADLNLVAKVFCADGRTNDSTPISVRYFPVDFVVRPPAGGQLVTDLFVIDGQDQNVSFIGCSGNANGTTSLVRVNAAGVVTGENATLPFPCSRNMWFTDRNLTTGKRWAVEPGVGIFAFDQNVNITAFLVGPVTHLAVGPDGDAVHYTSGSGTEVLQRMAHDGGAQKWIYQPSGVVTGNPIVDPTFGIFVPTFVDSVGQMKGEFVVDNVRYEDGAGIDAARQVIIPYGLGDAPPVPPSAFSPSGGTVYLAYQTSPTAATVVACSARVGGCGGSERIWTSASLPAHIVALVPYSSGSILAAVAPNATWFLDATTGVILNRGGEAIRPQGTLVTMAVQQGHGNDFYLLNGSGQPGSLPVELVAVDDPEFGELFRYSDVGSSMTAGIDEAGSLWLRIGPDLVKPLPLGQYQQVVQR